MNLSTTWRQYFFLTLLFTLIAMMLLSPLSSNLYIPNLWDIWNHVATITHAKLALAEGQFPLRVAPLALNNWRYPQFQFYSPTSYTFAGFIYQWVTPSNPFIAYKITLMAALIFGGLYFYRLAHWLVRFKLAATLAAVVYLTSPYYIIVINHVGGFNEAIALSVLPAVLYYTLQRYYYPRDYRTLLQVGLAWYLLATIHFITFFYTSLMVALLLLFLTIRNPRHWLHLINVGIAYGFGCVLAMWYLGPIFILGKYFAVARSMVDEMFSPFLANLFSPTVNISGGLIYPEGYINVISQLHPNMGLPILFAIGVSFYFVLCKPMFMKRSSYFSPYLLGIFVIAFIMVWSPFYFWHYLPKFFSMFQYSWRLLSQVIWVGSLLFAWAILLLFKRELTVRMTVLGMLLIIMSSSAWLPITERSFLNAKDFFNKPTLMTNPDSYVIDAKKNRNFIQAMDSMTLDAFITQGSLGNLLKLDVAYPISKRLIDSSPFLSISLEGRFSTKIGNRHERLLVIADKTIIGAYELKPGSLQWTIPLYAMRHLLKNKPSVSLKFVIKNMHASSKINIEKIVLTNFIKPSEFLPVEQVEKNCKQDGIDTICNIQVSRGIQLLELPILFYPDMQRILLNGKLIPYISVFHQKYLLAGIVPKANQMNEIKIQFTGMLWANYVSGVGWGIWSLFLLFTILRGLQTKTVSPSIELSKDASIV